MKISYEQFYGSQEKFDLQLLKPILDLENSREVEAVEQGWLINEGRWYNCRSTRIKVDEFKKPQKVSGYKFTYYKTLSPEQVEQVDATYQAFLDYKGFERIYNLTPKDPRVSWLLCESDRINAFTMFNEYEGALESNLTAWDYTEPRKAIGKHIIGYEVRIALERGLKHLYIGPGCGTGAIYKAFLRGFQWWTGAEWSDDVDKYVMLCQRDDTITTIEELSALYAS